MSIFVCAWFVLNPSPLSVIGPCFLFATIVPAAQCGLPHETASETKSSGRMGRSRIELRSSSPGASPLPRCEDEERIDAATRCGRVRHPVRRVSGTGTQAQRSRQPLSLFSLGHDMTA